MSTTSTSLPKPALSHQNLIIFLLHSNGFFDDERRNQLFHGICAARYWNHVKTVGLWAWRNQNVTKTLGFYGGFKRNVWHRRWAKGGLKMVFVSRPGHAVSLFWGFFFSRCQRSSMSTISTSLAKPPFLYQNLIFFLVLSNVFFDDERRNQLFHGIRAARYWNRVKTVGLWAWRNQNVTKTLGFYSGFKRIQMVFLMMSGEISFSMVSARQGTGIMSSKLSVYGREETKTWPKP